MAYVGISVYRASGLDQAALVGICGRGRAGWEIKLGEDIADVPGNRLLTQVQLGGDDRLLLPAATRRSTSSSRAVSGRAE